MAVHNTYADYSLEGSGLFVFCGGTLLGPHMIALLALSHLKISKPRACWKPSFHLIRESVSCSVMSDSLQPHRLWPTRLLCPWNSSGKNTGVGSYSFLQEDLPDPGMEPRSPALQADSLPSKPQRMEPQKTLHS